MSAAPLSLVAVPELDALEEAAELRREVERLREALESEERRANRYERTLKRIANGALGLRENMEDAPLIAREYVDGGFSLLCGMAKQVL